MTTVTLRNYSKLPFNLITRATVVAQVWFRLRFCFLFCFSLSWYCNYCAIFPDSVCLLSSTWSSCLSFAQVVRSVRCHRNILNCSSVMWLVSMLVINTLTMLDTIEHADRGRPTLKDDERSRNTYAEQVFIQKLSNNLMQKLSLYYMQNQYNLAAIFKNSIVICIEYFERFLDK